MTRYTVQYRHSSGALLQILTGPDRRLAGDLARALNRSPDFTEVTLLESSDSEVVF
jgi:hypothetical protein